MPAAPRRSVALIGLRCSGKTSVGRRLAEILELPFADLDQELAGLHVEGDAEACSASSPVGQAGELLASLGEERFRALEERALERVLSAPGPLVLATGGGAVESPSSRELLRRACRCIWLRAEPEILRRRLAADPSPRPALTAAGTLAEIEELARRRAPLYRDLAAIRVESGHASVEELARDIAALLRGSE